MMRPLFAVLLLLVLPLLSRAAYSPSKYDVDWDAPSSLESQSMPLGNGDLTLSVWVNASTGSLMYYAQSASSYEENGQLLKLIRGRIDLALPASPQLSNFHQHLHLLNASQTISFSVGSLSVFALVWVDRFHQVVRWSVSTSQPVQARNSVEMWRTQVTPMGSNWQGGYYCDERHVYPDRLLTGFGDGKGELLWVHRNDGDFNNTLYDATLRQQSITGIGLEAFNPLVNRTFGGYLSHEEDAPNWTAAAVTKTWYGLTATLSSLKPTQSFRFNVYAHTEQPSTVNEWLKRFQLSVAEVRARPVQEALQAHTAWWSSFHDRSHVDISIPSDPSSGFGLSQVLLLQRATDAMDGINDFPIHFNGQGWNIGQYSDSPQGPDHRQWGSAFWWQNCRESYYSAAPAGDYDLLLPMFLFYQSLIHVQETRVREYYGHTGAFFEETITMFGLPTNSGFGYTCQGTKELHNNPFVRFHWDGSFELCLLMVQYWQFTGDDTFAVETMLPMCSVFLDFFYQHFPERDPNGHTVFFPSQSLETWQCPDPSDHSSCPVGAIIYISSVLATLNAMLALPSSLVSDELRARWTEQLAVLPPLPKGPCYKNTSLTCLLPAQGGWTPGRTGNSENVELYTVWPYAQYGVAQKDYSTIMNNYNLRPFPCNDGWCQDIADAAYLGLRDEYRTMALQRSKLKPAAGWKFPTFDGPLQDSTPAADHFSVLRTASNAMILQEVASTQFSLDALMEQRPDAFVVSPRAMERRAADEPSVLLLFAALPAGWDVDFKLRASGSALIEGSCVNDTLVNLTVTPASRKNDVILVGCAGKEGSLFETERKAREGPTATSA